MRPHSSECMMIVIGATADTGGPSHSLCTQQQKTCIHRHSLLLALSHSLNHTLASTYYALPCFLRSCVTHTTGWSGLKLQREESRRNGIVLVQPTKEITRLFSFSDQVLICTNCPVHCGAVVWFHFCGCGCLPDLLIFLLFSFVP